jgi:hypothetical protein
MELLYEVDSSGYPPTGRVTHFVDGSPAEDPKSLAIVRIGDDPGYYFIRRDGAGNEITDTYHDSIDQAFEQAEFELEIPRTAWVLKNGPRGRGK